MKLIYILITNILYVPNLNKNLFSENVITKNLNY